MEPTFQSPHAIPNGNSQFISDPVLYFLREDIADELGAIVGYLECADLAKDYRIGSLFREIANDEMEHFIRLMGALAQNDSVQAEEFQKTGFSEVLMGTQGTNPYGIGYPFQCQACLKPEKRRHDYNDKRVYMADDRMVECLQNSIRDELKAINAYQRQLKETSNPAIQNLLTVIMNQEKEHVSEFTKLFYAIYDN
jgi:rubrerythrin